MAYKITDILKSENLPHLFLFYGSEDYLKRQYKDNVLFALQNPSQLNITRLVNKSKRKEEGMGFLSEIVSMANTLPFFAPCRVIICENSMLFRYENKEFLAFLDNIPETSYLIFLEDEAEKKNKNFIKANSVGFCEEYPLPDSKMLYSWVQSLAKKEGKTITKNATELFLEGTSLSMENMYREFCKLSSYCLDRDTISEEDVRAICTISFDEDIYAFVDKVVAGERKASMDLYGGLYSTGASHRSILNALISRFTQLLTAKNAAASGKSISEIAAAIRVYGRYSDYIAKKVLEASARFSAKKLTYLIDEGAKTIEKLNTGLLKEETGVELYIMKCLKETDN